MKRSAPARVVVVSSLAHTFRGLDLDDLNFERRKYSAHKAYASSKVANVLFAAELSRRLIAEGVQGVTVNSLHPGYVRTELARYLPLLQRLPVVLLSYVAGKSSEEGAQTSLYCALSEDLEGVSGKYFSDCRMKQPSRTARDEKIARHLWEISERITGLSK
jgi:retinol dehydrogenase-12